MVAGAVELNMRNEHLLERIYDAALEPKAWVAFVQAFEETLGGARVVLGLPHPSPGDPGELVAPSLDPRFVAAFQTRYFDLDPWSPRNRVQPVGTFELGRRAISDACLRETPFYREWMEPQGFRLPEPVVRGVIERDEQHGVAVLTIFRPDGARRMGSAVRHIGEFLVPHLRRAVQIHFRKTQLESERRALTAALDRLTLGLILVDGRGHVCATNRAADRILAQRDGLALDREGLRAANPEQTAQLRELLVQSAQATGPERLRGAGLLLTRGTGRRPLQASVARLPAPGAALGGERFMVALFVNDPEEGMQAPRELLQSLFGLTPAEAALASLLAGGQSLEEAARELGITRGTARQRLGQIFAKTATCRQASLVRMLLSSPAHLRAVG
jgi:DNA-binding CsgD family transcriptional regulator